MSADLLREAASSMRDNARAAMREHGRDLWTSMPAIDPDNNGYIVCEQRQPDVDWDTTVARTPYDYDGGLAKHIASWHPIVALYVADWLDLCAERLDEYPDAIHPDVDSVFAVARVYLEKVATA